MIIVAAVAAANRTGQRKGSDMGARGYLLRFQRVLTFCLLSNSIVASMTLGDTGSRIDYVAKLNEISRKDRDESLNAAPFYQKATELYVAIPEGIGNQDIDRWPSELTDKKQSLLRKWTESNGSAFAQLKLGTRKPYFWSEYRGNHMWDVRSTLDLPALRDIVRARLLHVKLIAGEDVLTREMREDILACCRFGFHLAQTYETIEQLVGMGTIKKTVQTVFLCLAKTEYNHAALDLLQSGLQKQFLKSQSQTFNIEVERLRLLEIVQMLFEGNEDDNKLKPEEEMEIS